jgi:hypothetical protein
MTFHDAQQGPSLKLINLSAATGEPALSERGLSGSLAAISMMVSEGRWRLEGRQDG